MTTEEIVFQIGLWHVEGVVCYHCNAVEVLEREFAGLGASRLRLAKEITRRVPILDHACHECSDSRIVVPGFVCAYHEARRIVEEEGG